ncbi:MAG: hypothetical protein MK101_03420 [Phycisphaerales bacterium]|nr:hypothetical protein [Phycisphaerales bacterium]
MITTTLILTLLSTPLQPVAPTDASAQVLEGLPEQAVIAPVIADGASAQSLIDLAGDDLSKGRWTDAAHRLQAARQRLDDPPAVLAYDEGVAWAKAQQWEQAAEAFSIALERSSDPGLSADAAYNLGNSSNQLHPTPDARADQQAAIDGLREALGHYREAIARTPDALDARANAQLTWERLQQLLEQQQQQEQAQDQDQQQDQSQSQDDADQGEQDQAEQNQDQSQEQEQGQDDADQGEQQQDQQQQEDASDEGEQQDQSESPQQDESQPQDQQQQQQQNEPGKQDQQQPQQGEPSQQEQAQQPPNEAAQSQADSQQQAAGQPQGEARPMSPQEAMRLLQRVRDRAKAQAEKDAQERPGRPSTGKDW